MTSIRLIVILLSIVILTDDCNAKEHTFGYGRYGKSIYERTIFSDNQYFQRELINTNDNGIKNYVVHFNFEGDGFKEVTYVAINVINANNSDAVINASGTNVNAKVNIYSGQNVKVTISVNGESNLPYGYFKVFRDMENVKSKSLTFVYVKKSQPILPKKYAQNSIGNRRKGDQLIYFETRNVTNFSRFPSRGMKYAGNGKEYITYVGFSFNSPTAMALVNSTFAEEQEFNAVVYDDMYTEHFMVNMSVYAIVSDKRPSDFVGVI